jgi:hypothetical protein
MTPSIDVGESEGELKIDVDLPGVEEKGVDELAGTTSWHDRGPRSHGDDPVAILTACHCARDLIAADRRSSHPGAGVPVAFRRNLRTGWVRALALGAESQKPPFAALRCGRPGSRT